MNWHNNSDIILIYAEKIKVKRRVEKEYRDRDRRYKDERNYNATQTKVIESDGVKLVKVAAWYDNEMSYTSQMIRTAKYLIDIMEE